MAKRIPGTHFARNLIERRTLITQLVKRDFQQRYIGSAAGWLWGLVHPLVLLASYVFIFDICMHQKTGPGAVTTNYPMLLFAGMLPWLLFSETVQRSAGCLIEQSNLITKTVFPAEIVPVSIFLSSLMSHVLAVALVVAGAAIFLHHISPILLALPVAMLLVGLLAIGIGWIAAAFQVYLRDTAQFLMVVLTLWFWATPILLTENQFPKWARVVLWANPLTYIVHAYQNILLGHSISLAELGPMAGFAIASFVIGGLVFRYMKRGFADVL